MADPFDAAWEQRYVRGLALNEYPYDVIVALTARYFPRGGPGAALDLGCGAGNHSLFLARQGFAVTGVDVSAAALDIARARSQRDGLTASFQQMSFDEIDALGGPFDLIVDRFALACMDFETLCSTVMPKLHRLLAPGGFLFSVFPSDADPMARPDGSGYTRIVAERRDVSPVRVTFVDRAGIERLFADFVLKELHLQVRATLHVAPGAPDIGALAEFIVVAERAQ